MLVGAQQSAAVNYRTPRGKEYEERMSEGHGKRGYDVKVLESKVTAKTIKPPRDHGTEPLKSIRHRSRSHYRSQLA